MLTAEKIVLTDMDGVIADFDGKVKRDLKNLYPDVPIPQPRKSFYIDDDMAPEHKPVIREIISNPGFFTELGVIEGAHEGWEQLLEAGYTPQICTAPLRKNPTCNQDKLSWLEEHFVPRFGHWVIDTAIITKDKASCEGFVIIEDRPEIKDAHRAIWKHVVFDQPYNRDASSPYRLAGWKDPLIIPLLQTIKSMDA